MSKQLRPISFLGPFFAVIAINKGFLRLLIILSKTMGRKRSDFDCLRHCKANIKLTPVTWSFNLRKTSCFTWSRKSSLCLKSGPKWGRWVVKIYQSIQLKYLKIFLPLHCPATFHTARPSREQFTVNQKSSLWLIHLKYSMKAPALVSIKESKEALKKIPSASDFFLACSESSLYIPRHSNQFKQCVCWSVRRNNVFRSWRYSVLTS